MLVGFVSHVLVSELQSTSRQEQNGCNWKQQPGGGEAQPALCANSAPSGLLGAECGASLTGLASHEEAQQDQQQKRAELELGFLAREYQENNPTVSDMGNIKYLVCIYLTIV